MHPTLEELAMLPYESSFVIRAEEHENGYRLHDVQLVQPGRTHNARPSITHPDAASLREDSEERGLMIFEGHTHPTPYGERIRGYNCGWTVPRTAELRDLRNTRLAATPGGKAILREREDLLRQLATDPDNKALLDAIIEHAPEYGHCNLVTINGFSGYITNRPNIRDPEEFSRDISTRPGDFQRHDFLTSFGRAGQALVHAKPEYFNTPAAPEKYVLSALQVTGPNPEDARPVRIYE